MDDYGATSTPVATKIYVQDLPLLTVDLILNNSVVSEGGQVPLTVYVTDGTAAVQNATVNMLSITGGQFTSSGYTNSSGYFVTTYTALNVTEVTNVRIVATASKIGYADNSNYEYLQVLPYFAIQISINPNPVKSEEQATMIVYVEKDEEPIANASVIVSSSVGNLNPQSGTTDSNGTFILVFTAPQTTTFLNATITAVITKTNYMISVSQAQLIIEPKVPIVKITTTSNITLSGAKLTVKANVEYDAIPLQGSNITITTSSANSSIATGVTNSNGNVTLTLLAPLVNRQTNITITAKATEMGYAETEDELIITVIPRTFNVQITAPQTISGEPTTISVFVTCKEDGTVVPNATVFISSTAGNFSETTSTTDQNGTSTFTFYAPQTSSQLYPTVTANVTENGYADGTGTETISVMPKNVSQAGGWPLMTILLVLVPALIVVVVVLLIKLKIISISFGEEQSGEDNRV
jgi:hypothetical protein